MSSEKVIVNSWNEWDPLKHVIVGAVENANIPPMEPALEPNESEILSELNLDSAIPALNDPTG